MKRKFLSLALSAVLLSSSLSLLVSCGEKPSADLGFQLKTRGPVCFTDGAYTDSSIATSTFTVEYDASHKLTASLADESLGTLTELSSTEADGVLTVTYQMTSNGVTGNTKVNFTEKKNVVASVPAAVKTAYPEEGPKAVNANRAERFTHDPVILEVPEGYEVNGETYYYFSYCTDNFGGGYGAPVKGSKDLLSWERLGSAIPDFGTKENEVRSKCLSGESELQDVYDVLSSKSSWGNVWTLWAPEVVPAYGGGYWLYGSWTDAFGSRRSVIFQCYSESPVGPFKFQNIIVYSPNTRNDGKQANAIDPSIFYDANGDMYMSYGSFSDIRCIPLDKTTGFRRDGAKFTVAEMSSASDFYMDYYDDYSCDWNADFDALSVTDKYFGEMILKNTGVEGSVVEYFKDVPVYEGNVADYDASKLTYESNYYMVVSAGGLDRNYSMRTYKSKTATGTFTDSYSSSVGSLISGTYVWNDQEETGVYSLNYFVPGHNDLLTTAANEHFITYHNRVWGSDKNFATDLHFLTTSLTAFNSKGDLVMSPLRYAGESLRKVTKDEITKLSSGNYYGVVNTANNFGNIQFAKNYKLNADGTISGAQKGTWTLYGENYIYIKLGGVDYYGVVMPAYCTQPDASAKNGYSGKGGLAISAIGSSGGSARECLYLEMVF